MNIEVAKTAGFCFGVRRAVEMVYEQIEQQSNDTIYTYGPIIHNEEVIKDLERRGVCVLHDPKDLQNIDEGIVIIRSHGVPSEVYELIGNKGLTCVDATCVFVKKIHRIVQEESEKGAHIVLIGNREHPEVKGIRGWVQGDVSVFRSREEAEAFEMVDPHQKVCVVAQTTFNYKKFKELVEIISEKGYDISVFDTICSATRERQEEAGDIAKRVDVMLVIGDQKSSNTRKLFEICKHVCADTYYIQTMKDLDVGKLRSAQAIGITAGASTPNNIIEEVHNNVRTNI